MRIDIQRFKYGEKNDKSIRVVSLASLTPAVANNPENFFIIDEADSAMKKRMAFCIISSTPYPTTAMNLFP